jgi:hypothetical protein
MENDNIYRPPQAEMEAPAPLAVAAQGEREKEPAPFFQTSLLKVALLSVATLGLYQLFWFYRQWERCRENGEDVSPLARSIFSVLFAYLLFESVNDEIRQRADLEIARRGPADLPASPDVPIAPLQAGLLAFLYFALNVVRRIPGVPNLWIGVLLLTWVPLVIAQKKMNELHAKLGYDPAEGSAFTAGSIAALVVGGLFWILVMIGIYGVKR